MDNSWPSLRAMQSLTAPQPAKSKKGSKGRRPPKRDPQDEEVRIEAAMRLIDTAKQQMQEKRMEYGRFLQKKVKTQREMWKKREAEEEAQRSHVEEQLLALRRERQRQLREERRRYYTPLPRLASEDAEEPPPRAHSFRTKRIEAALEQIDLQTLSAAQPVMMMIPVEPGDSTPHKDQRRGPRHTEARNPFDVLRDEVTLEDVFRLPFLEKELAALFLVERQPSPPLMEEKVLQWPRNPRLERTTARVRKMEQMLHDAKARRQRATTLLRADPPADCLLEEGQAADAPVRSDKDLMFMTEVDVDPTLPIADVKPLVQKQRRIGRRGHYSHFNPHAELLSPTSGGPRATAWGEGSMQKSGSLKSTVQPSSPVYQTLDRYLQQMGQPASPMRLPELVPQRGHVVISQTGELALPV